MRLVSVYFRRKSKFIADWINIYEQGLSLDLWSSGAMVAEGKFNWTATRIAFGHPNQTNWNPGEPSNLGKCVYLLARNDSDNLNMAVDDCAARKNFLCEVKVNFNVLFFVQNNVYKSS
jgi:hypothetical protein